MIFDKVQLQKNYAKCKAAADKTNVIQSLTMLRIQAKDGSYKMISANGIYQIICQGDYSGENGFDLCFDVDKFGVMISASKDNITLTNTDGKVCARSGKSKFNFDTLPGSEFPIIDHSSGQNINGNLKTIIGNVFIGAQDGNVQQLFNGVYIESLNGEINSVVTDGSYLCFNRNNLDNENDFNFILPTKSAIVASSIDSYSFIFDKGKSVTIMFSDGSILTSKLIDGVYPNWRKVINFSDSKSMIIDKESLVESISIAMKVSDKIVTFDIKENEIMLSSSSHGFKCETGIDIDSTDVFTESFNSMIVDKMLKIIDMDTLEIFYSSNESGTRKYKCSDGLNTFIMMPIRA